MEKKIVFGAILVVLFLLQAETVFTQDRQTNNLLDAVNSGNLADARRAIQRGADVNYIKTNFGSPLYVAIKKRNLEMARLLLENGAKPSDTLTYAVRDGNLEMARLLLDKGANTKGTSFMAPPLVAAAEIGNLELVRLLVERGADINERDEERVQNLHDGRSRTALHYAVSKRMDIVRYLVENGINVNARADNGETALSIAYDRGEMAIYDYLKANGAIEFEQRQVTQQPSAPAQSTTNVYVQPSAPAQSTPAPAPAAPAGWNLSVLAGQNNIGGTWNSSVGTGNFMVLNGTGSSGTVSIQAFGKLSTGTASISGNSLNLYITSGEFKGEQFRYTIVTNKLIQGNGENFSRY